MKITYFVHGTTTDNEAGKATGWLPGELSSLGVQQAEELPKSVADNSFTVVFASDLKRAIDSAKLGFEQTHEIRIDKRLREADYGDWNGMDDVFKNNLVEYISTPFPNGESYRDIEKRIREFLDEAKQEFAFGHIAIMAHEAPQLALEVIANGKTWEEAIAANWRATKSWQPGWIYEIN